MAEYRGNTFLEITKALNEGKTRYLLTQSQMEQIIAVNNAVIEAKNEVVRENWRLLHPELKEAG